MLPLTVSTLRRETQMLTCTQTRIRKSSWLAEPQQFDYRRPPTTLIRQSSPLMDETHVEDGNPIHLALPRTLAGRGGAHRSDQRVQPASTGTRFRPQEP